MIAGTKTSGLTSRAGGQSLPSSLAAQAAHRRRDPGGRCRRHRAKPSAERLSSPSKRDFAMRIGIRCHRPSLGLAPGPKLTCPNLSLRQGVPEVFQAPRALPCLGF